MQTLSKNNSDIHFPGSKMTRIVDTTNFIFPFICLLQIKFGSGIKGHATGTLINGKYVLTAAHNVHNKQYGKAIEVTVIPGQNGDLKPFGEFQMERFFVPDEYADDPASIPAEEENIVQEDHVYDYALIELKEADNRQNPLSIHVATNEELTQGDASITGYPGDKPAGSMWEASGQLRIKKEVPALLFYQISTFRGDSGSGIQKNIDKNCFITGIHVAGSSEENTNFGVRITQEVSARISQWMQQK
ncbi:trypsin-like serine protease [Terrimonas sp. NA20]|uniref:Serine protease n=1 Tax=Terrimonas ginsenosidimutans TaxID=2908004 RepID=A0ABS9KUZ5_9BACT|nr:trypsin-like serine protease [Terrimonas ginsenosidimutans]MCG2616167.1 trypsin-like serine protease [Terrimonas ginsenosidimutans]